MGFDHEQLTRFTEGLTRSYPPTLSYFAHHEGPEFTASSSLAFLKARQLLLEGLLNGEAIQEELSQALALEHFVHLALRLPLEGTGFEVKLTPQSLERSQEGQKGVDLLITDDQHLVYLGMDVKLRKGKSKYQRDGFGWNQNLLSPYIYLSLGNFVVDMREQSAISVREWLKTYSIPKISSSGKIPQLDHFRAYLITRIERSINGYIEGLREMANYPVPFGMPPAFEELVILEEKLQIMHSLFVEFRMNL